MLLLPPLLLPPLLLPPLLLLLPPLLLPPLLLMLCCASRSRLDRPLTTPPALLLLPPPLLPAAGLPVLLRPRPNRPASRLGRALPVPMLLMPTLLDRPPVAGA
jgi:hypothetical protein